MIALADLTKTRQGLVTAIQDRTYHHKAFPYMLFEELESRNLVLKIILNLHDSE
jgi:hypothetical protein